MNSLLVLKSFLNSIRVIFVGTYVDAIVADTLVPIQVKAIEKIGWRFWRAGIDAWAIGVKLVVFVIWVSKKRVCINAVFIYGDDIVV